MRISDWSSDVCSSDLPACAPGAYGFQHSDDRTSRPVRPRSWAESPGSPRWLPGSRPRRVRARHFGHVRERRFRRARQRSSGRPGLRACRRGGAGSLPRLRHGRSCPIHEPYRTASGSELGEIEPSLDAPASLLAVRFIVSKTGQRRQWSRFEKMGTVHAVTIAEHHGDLRPVLVEILGQKRDDLVAHDVLDIGAAAARGEIGMTDLVLAIEEMLDPLIDGPQQRAKVDPIKIVGIKTGQRRQWLRLEKMGTVHAVTIAGHPGDLRPSLVEILGQKRDDLVAHDVLDIGAAAARGEIGMTDLVLAIEEMLDPLIDGPQQRAKVDPIKIVGIKLI